MRVGGLEESITVSGRLPVVDVQSATEQQVLTQRAAGAVPTGRNIWGVGATLNGVTLSAPDVGGTAGMQQTYMAVHGSDRRDNAIQVDGMSVNGIEGDGAIQNYFNQGMFEEMSYQTSALGAEVPVVGRAPEHDSEGRQQHVQGVAVLVADAGLVAEQQLHPRAGRARAARAEPVRADLRPEPRRSAGRSSGPLWFFSTFRRWGVDQTITDSFYNADPRSGPTCPICRRPTVDDNVIKSGPCG